MNRLMRLVTTSRHLILLLLPLWLAACAPQTVLVKRYIPPVEASGQACLQTCETALVACQSRCKAERDACEEQAEARARETLPAALDAYADAMERYRTDMLFWRLNHWHTGAYFGHGRPYWGGGWFMYDYDPLPALPPGPPTLASETARARAACRKDCGCQPPYEACFLRCGGRIVEEQRPLHQPAQESAP